MALAGELRELADEQAGEDLGEEQVAQGVQFEGGGDAGGQAGEEGLGRQGHGQDVALEGAPKGREVKAQKGAAEQGEEDGEGIGAGEGQQAGEEIDGEAGKRLEEKEDQVRGGAVSAETEGVVTEGEGEVFIGKGGQHQEWHEAERGDEEQDEGDDQG